MTMTDKTSDRISASLRNRLQSETSVHAAVEPLVVSPLVAGRMLDRGRKTIYRLMAEGELVSFKDGRSRKITVASIHEHIDRCMAASAGSKPKRPA